jgi:hypothetical protein
MFKYWQKLCPIMFSPWLAIVPNMKWFKCSTVNICSCSKCAEFKHYVGLEHQLLNMGVYLVVHEVFRRYLCQIVTEEFVVINFNLFLRGMSEPLLDKFCWYHSICPPNNFSNGFENWNRLWIPKCLQYHLSIKQF